MGNTVNWVIGGLIGLLALMGLYLASRAVDEVIYWTGLGFFVFGVAFCFYLINRNVGSD